MHVMLADYGDSGGHVTRGTTKKLMHFDAPSIAFIRFRSKLRNR